MSWVVLLTPRQGGLSFSLEIEMGWNISAILLKSKTNIHPNYSFPSQEEKRRTRNPEDLNASRSDIGYY